MSNLFIKVSIKKYKIKNKRIFKLISYLLKINYSGYTSVFLNKKKRNILKYKLIISKKHFVKHF